MLQIYTRDKLAINNVNFLIKKGERIGLIGSTGFQTTLIDVLIGLLEPTVGNVYVEKIFINQMNQNLYLHGDNQYLMYLKIFI